MNYFDMFDKFDSLGSDNPYMNMNNTSGPSPYQSNFYNEPPIMDLEREYTGLKANPVLYNVDGWISPYVSSNWGGTSKILQYMDDGFRSPTLENRVDPNKIFSSELNGLRALAADQQRIVKLFEKRLMESLTEKGKVGLTEGDVEAMSALTSARSAITSISKEQSAIKKSIAELKIKQAQQRGDSSNTDSAGRGRLSNDTMSIGRSILDSIFDAPTDSSIPVTNVDYSSTSAGDAGRVLDNLVSNVNNQIQFESMEPTTYVVIGDTDDDIEFVTYSSSGDIIPDFPNPTSKVTTIDREAMKATDEFLVQYPVKHR